MRSLKCASNAQVSGRAYWSERGGARSRIVRLGGKPLLFRISRRRSARRAPCRTGEAPAPKGGRLCETLRENAAARSFPRRCVRGFERDESGAKQEFFFLSLLSASLSSRQRARAFSCRRAESQRDAALFSHRELERFARGRVPALLARRAGDSHVLYVCSVKKGEKGGVSVWGEREGGALPPFPRKKEESEEEEVVGAFAGVSRAKPSFQACSRGRAACSVDASEARARVGARV